MKHTNLPLLVAMATAVTAVAQAQTDRPTPTPSPPDAYSVTERGPHHCVWSRVIWQTNALGNAVAFTNAYTELATGLHYEANGQWQEMKEEIVPWAGGAVARQGPHKVIFAYNLNTAGAIDLQTPGGKRLRSHVLGLRFLDASSGKSVLIGLLKDSQGTIVGGNQVLYADAFRGVKADVRYTYTKAGFEQDIILREQPPAPEALELNPASTRLQVITEFLEPPPVTAVLSPMPARDGGPPQSACRTCASPTSGTRLSPICPRTA